MGPALTSAAPLAYAFRCKRVVACCLLGCVVAATGCRSNAYRDVYAEKMAAEIRALEDQLYAADYENQVLHQKLQRARTGQLDQPETLDEPDAADALRRPRASDQQAPGGNDGPLPRPGQPADADPLDLQFPDIDPGQPRSEKPRPPADLPDADDDVQERRIEVPGADLGIPRVNPQQPQPVPPSSDELTLPPIDPGEIMPPPGRNAPPEPPPGQIPLPEALLPVEPALPSGLAIHPIYSGGHNFDADPMIDGVFLVVQFVDEAGTAIDMGDMEIDAQLVIVLLDPETDEEDPRLGRWEFSADEVAKLRRDSPVDGLHVPLRWDDRKPAGQQVAAFVRLVNGPAKLEGQRVLPLGGASAVADWTPRAAERLQAAAENF